MQLSETQRSSIHKKITWLNGKGGFGDSIDHEKVFEAANGLNADQIFEVLKHAEEKKGEITNANSWICKGLRGNGGGRGVALGGFPQVRPNFGAVVNQQAFMRPIPMMGQMQMAAPSDDRAVRKKIGWLNSKGGFNNTIGQQEVSEVMQQTGAPVDVALRVLSELEEKKDEVRDATAYVTSAIRKSAGKSMAAPRMAVGFANPMPMFVPNVMPNMMLASNFNAVDKAIRKRCGRANGEGGFNNTLKYREIAEAAQQAGADEFAVNQAFDHVEQNIQTVKDPTAYVSNAIRQQARKFAGGGGGGGGGRGIAGGAVGARGGGGARMSFFNVGALNKPVPIRKTIVKR